MNARLIDRLRRINQWLLVLEQRNMQNSIIAPWPYCVTVTRRLIDKPLEKRVVRLIIQVKKAVGALNCSFQFASQAVNIVSR